MVDIAPEQFPVRVNAMFTERSADSVVDPLVARALVLDNGTTQIALCVVDSCMLPRDLLDRAKTLAAASTGIPTDRMLISATHTHSAPSAMGCLGSRVDPAYAAFLPARIAAAIIGAAGRLAPAKIAWTSFDDWDHTFNRRWIRRPDRLLTDPFGNATVRAHMHPGHESPDAVGPSGPVDPGLTLLAVAAPDGRPIAILANYSQHYYTSPLLSSDYYGRFAQHLTEGLGADEAFVAMMSQGTSGDLMWMDYAAPARDIGYDAYAREMAGRVLAAYRELKWHDTAALQMAERTLPLRYRVPDADRLAWARRITTALGDKLPSNLPEIYAWEAVYLHERQQTELQLQALRIGDLGIATLPNEVFALTGLKLKAQSPLPLTMNISLANGAEGYIPPPEQHRLGGYTTWPARTAGLEEAAEPRIVEALLELLEQVAGGPRRTPAETPGPYTRAVLAAEPLAYWRLEEMAFPVARDAGGRGPEAGFEDGVALYLPGAGSGTGVSPDPALTPSAFSEGRINRAVQFAGGRLRSQLPLDDQYTILFWLWNGLPADARAVTGYLVSRGADGDPGARGEHLGIGGTFRPELAGRLFVFNGNERNEVIGGRTSLSLKNWHQVALVREGQRVRVHLDGQAEPELEGELRHTLPSGETNVFFGGRNDGEFGLEGRMDEIAVFPRALSAAEIAALHATSALKPPGAAAATAPPPAAPPLSPEASLRAIQVAPGFRVELVAAEPLTLDPVAIDWDASGRLWVVEMADYPLGMDGRGKPGGRVRVLEDRDGDGRLETATLFADGLNFPTGLLTWRDGVIVTAAPEILFLRDTNGDGRADTREVLVSGLMAGNQQLRVNGLRWGLDNWVHCAAGAHYRGYGADTRLRTRSGETEVGSRDFRFRPDTGQLEPVSGPSQFGRERDDWGRWFGTQNIRPLWHYVLEDHYLRRNPWVAAPEPTQLVVGPLSPQVFPVSAAEKRFHSFNEAGHFTSACSGMIYRDDLLFPGRPVGEENAFTCEPFHNLVQRNRVQPEGVSFTARREAGGASHDFLASADRWCRPVMIRTGPDGALWVVDMYRYMIEHPDWLPQAGRDELLPHYRLGEDRGRIYRVVPEGATGRPVPRLDQLTPAALVAALDSPNGWQRDQAHQLLVQAGGRSAVSSLIATARDSLNPLARLHALCVLDGLDALTPDLVPDALEDPHPGVRENALRLAEGHQTPAVLAAVVRRVDDPAPRVRQQLASSLGAWPDREAGRALGRLAVDGAADPFQRASILSSAVPHTRELTAAVAQVGGAVFDKLAEPLALVALGNGDRDSLAVLLEPLLRADEGGQFTAVQVDGFAQFLAVLNRRQVSLDSLAAGGDLLAVRLRGRTALLDWARTMLRSDGPVDDRRLAAARLLGAVPEGRAEALVVFGEWLDPHRPGEIQRAAVAGLAATGEDAVPALLLNALPAFPPESTAAALDALLSRESWTLALLRHGASAGLPAMDASRRSRLLKHPSSEVRNMAARLLEAGSQRAEVVARFQPALELGGDPRRGAAVYALLCVSCHRRGDAGAEIGPDLRSVAGHPPEKLLTNILDPSADIQPGYLAYQCQLTDGTELYGLITAETGNSLTFKLTDGTLRAVSRQDIGSLRSANLSLMPDGLEAGLGLQDLADLIQFIRSPEAPFP